MDIEHLNHIKAMTKNRLDCIEWIQKREEERIGNKTVDPEVMKFIKELERIIAISNSELWIEKHKIKEVSKEDDLKTVIKIAWRYLMAYNGNRLLQKDPMEGEELKDYEEQCNTINKMIEKYQLDLNYEL